MENKQDMGPKVFLKKCWRQFHEIREAPWLCFFRGITENFDHWSILKFDIPHSHTGHRHRPSGAVYGLRRRRTAFDGVGRRWTASVTALDGVGRRWTALDGAQPRGGPSL